MIHDYMGLQKLLLLCYQLLQVLHAVLARHLLVPNELLLPIPDWQLRHHQQPVLCFLFLQLASQNHSTYNAIE
jgi:hypothetical protein